MVEICKYLSLNDAIHAFSHRIVTLLGQSDAKMHIVEPCEDLSDMIYHRLNAEQLVAFCSNTDQSSWKIIADYFTKYSEIRPLTLLNAEHMESFSQVGYYFPRLTRLSLRYDHGIDLVAMKSIFRYLPRSILRFEIHSTRILCSHNEQEESPAILDFNYRLRSFRLDLDNYPLITSEECFREHPACFLVSWIQFLRFMPMIRYLHLIINRYDL